TGMTVAAATEAAIPQSRWRMRTRAARLGRRISRHLKKLNVGEILTAQSIRKDSTMRPLAVLGIVFELCASVVGQGGSTNAGVIIGTAAFTVFVENMDRSLAFYHDVFGMDVPALPSSGERPYNPANPRLFAMFDIPGARERHQSARIAGTRV